jgi:hypothetical protein
MFFQIGVVPVDGTVSIIDELQNSDGVWVRLSQEALLKYSPTHTVEGWCLQVSILLKLFIRHSGRLQPCSKILKCQMF